MEKRRAVRAGGRLYSWGEGGVSIKGYILTHRECRLLFYSGSFVEGKSVLLGSDCGWGCQGDLGFGTFSREIKDNVTVRKGQELQ